MAERTTEEVKLVNQEPVALSPGSESVPVGAPPTELIGNLIDPIDGGRRRTYVPCVCEYGGDPSLLVGHDFDPDFYRPRMQAPLAVYPTRFTTLGLPGLPARLVCGPPYVAWRAPTDQLICWSCLSHAG